jgi:hypothetical protein
MYNSTNALAAYHATAYSRSAEPFAGCSFDTKNGIKAFYVGRPA